MPITQEQATDKVIEARLGNEVENELLAFIAQLEDRELRSLRPDFAPEKVVDILRRMKAAASSQQSAMTEDQLAEAVCKGMELHEAKHLQSISASRVGSTQLQVICTTAGVKIDPPVAPDVLLHVAAEGQEDMEEVFMWGPEDEDQQENRYSTYLSGIFEVPECLEWLPCGNKKSGLLNLQTRGKMGYRQIKGSTDMCIVTSAAARSETPRRGLCVLFELKKNKIKPEDVCQAQCELLLANILSPRLRPVVVLTDLRNAWHLYWMSGTSILGGACKSKKAAVLLINQLVQVFAEEELSRETGGQTQPRSSTLIEARQQLPDLLGPTNTSSVACLADLEGMLSDEEMGEVRATVAMQQLLRVPVFAMDWGLRNLSSPPDGMYI